MKSLAMFGCAVCILLVPIVGCDSSAVIALLLIGMFVYGFITAGEYGVITEYAPDFSGTVFGVANTLACATGFIGPMLVGYLLEHGVIHQGIIVRLNSDRGHFLNRRAQLENNGTSSGTFALVSMCLEAYSMSCAGQQSPRTGGWLRTVAEKNRSAP